MQYSIKTAISTVLLASTLTSAIPVAQQSTKVTIEFTGPSELARQDQVIANGQPQKVIAEGVSDASVIDANGLNQVQCLAYDSQGMQISSAFGLNKQTSLIGPANDEGTINVAKVACSADGSISSAPDHSGTMSSGQHAGDHDGPSNALANSMSKRATNINNNDHSATGASSSSTGAAQPTGSSGGNTNNNNGGDNTNNNFGGDNTNNNEGGDNTNNNQGGGNTNNNSGGNTNNNSGGNTNNNGPSTTRNNGPSATPTLSKNANNGGSASKSGFPFVRISLSGLSELERQQPIRADGEKHKVRGAVQITEASIIADHGNPAVECHAFSTQGKKVGKAFTPFKKAELGSDGVGVDIAKVMCMINEFPPDGLGPVITDPIETTQTPVPQATGMGNTNNNNGGGDTNNNNGGGNTNNNNGGGNVNNNGPASSITTAPGPEATGPFKSSGDNDINNNGGSSSSGTAPTGNVNVNNNN